MDMSPSIKCIHLNISVHVIDICMQRVDIHMCLLDILVNVLSKKVYDQSYQNPQYIYYRLYQTKRYTLKLPPKTTVSYTFNLFL